MQKLIWAVNGKYNHWHGTQEKFHKNPPLGSISTRAQRDLWQMPYLLQVKRWIFLKKQSNSTLKALKEPTVWVDPISI